MGWFQSFLTPLIIMAAIPFSLVGILPAHGLLNAFFTATSMIGFIAGAGIVVRNSIILVDFIELRLSEGMPLDEAVIDAGAVRFRPMMLTAAAVVVGSSVILFDPIFQGLAIALMAGEIASLLLSRMTVPVLFYLFNKHVYRVSSRAVVGALRRTRTFTLRFWSDLRKERTYETLFGCCLRVVVFAADWDAVQRIPAAQRLR